MKEFGKGISIVDEVSENLSSISSRLSPSHKLHMNRMIVARVIHADVASRFYSEGPNWAPLSPVYEKIKKSTKITQRGANKQPESLGKHPTPWGNIGVRYGNLFGSLGSVLRITADSVYYGTSNPYAKKFHSGFTGKRIEVTTKTGRVYYKDVPKGFTVPPRPFMYLSIDANLAIRTAVQDYMLAPKGKREILIPDFGMRIIGNNGRRVRLL